MFNFAKLNPKQRARLWHRRFAHCGPQAPRLLDSLDDQGIPAAIGLGKVDHRLHEDCTICDKAHVKVKPIRRIPPTMKRLLTPFHTVFVDGFGGQTSMGPQSKGGTFDNFGVRSVGGAVGGYVCCCTTTGEVVPYLYSRKSQFPNILQHFLIEVIAMHWKVHTIRATDSEIIDNGKVEGVCTDYDVNLEPTSVGTPAELGYGEKAVGDLVRRARALMIGAPHLSPSLWGAAIMHPGVLQFALPTERNGGVSYQWCSLTEKRAE